MSINQLFRFHNFIEFLISDISQYALYASSSLLVNNDISNLSIILYIFGTSFINSGSSEYLVNNNINRFNLSNTSAIILPAGVSGKFNIIIETYAAESPPPLAIPVTPGIIVTAVLI